MDNRLHLILNAVRERFIGVQGNTQWQKEASRKSQASGEAAKQKAPERYEDAVQEYYKELIR